MNIPHLFIRDLGKLLLVPIHIGFNSAAVGQVYLHRVRKMRRATRIIARYRTFSHLNGLRLSCCPLRIQGNHLVGASNVKIAMQRVVLICGTGAITFGIPACEYPAAVFEFVLFQRSLIGTRARTHLLIRHGAGATVGIVMNDIGVRIPLCIQIEIFGHRSAEIIQWRIIRITRCPSTEHKSRSGGIGRLLGSIAVHDLLFFVICRYSVRGIEIYRVYLFPHCIQRHIAILFRREVFYRLSGLV